ncbi:MAG: DsbE family thiol:disulfide interchange protein [Legionella sp.]|nr:DsbE family thiol:disulfide interchange protein [Legionella sp.]
MKLSIWRLLPVVVFAMLAIFLWRGLSLDPQKLPSVQVGHPLPAFNLPVLGDTQHQFNPAILQGKVLLLNVWASWCEACVEEQLFLMQLKEKGIPLYGLNYKDDAQNAAQWLTEWGNPYQLIGEDKDGKVAIDLGVYGAPETFLIDKKGFIRFRHVGILDEENWTREFLPRIQQLQGEA